MVNYMDRLAPEQAEAMKWDPPTPLDAVSLPRFSPEVFPDWLRQYVEAVAESTQTPPDAAAFAAFSVLATALQKKAKVNVTPDWSEPLNLYMILALPPGNRKSGVFKAMTNPVDDYEWQEGSRLAPVIAQQDAELKIRRKQLNHLTDQAAKKKDKDEQDKIMKEAQDLAAEIEELEANQKSSPQLYTDDVTGEALGVLMAEHDEKMSLLSAEGGGPLNNIAGRYDSKSVDSAMSLYLKAHPGDSAKVNRLGRAPIRLKSPALTIGLFIQPDALTELPDAFHGRGLLARFLYSVPESLIGDRKLNPDSIPEHVRMNFHRLLTVLLELNPQVPYSLKLSKGAAEIFTQTRAETERQIGIGGELDEAGLSEWGAKLDGHIARLAGLLHIAENVSSLPSIPIEIQAGTMAAAVSLKRYFIQHALKAFGQMTLRDGNGLMQYVLEKIIEKFPDKEQIGLRDLNQFTKRKKGLNSIAQLSDLLKELEELGYITLDTFSRKKTFCVNPIFRSTPGQYLPNEKTNSPIILRSGDKLGAMGTSGETHVPDENPWGARDSGEWGQWGQDSKEREYTLNPDGSGTLL